MSTPSVLVLLTLLPDPTRLLLEPFLLAQGNVTSMSDFLVSKLTLDPEKPSNCPGPEVGSPGFSPATLSHAPAPHPKSRRDSCWKESRGLSGTQGGRPEVME